MKAKVFYCFLCMFLVLTATSCGDKVDKALDNYEEYVDEVISDMKSGKILETLSTAQLQSKLEKELEFYQSQGEMSPAQERRYQKLHIKLLTNVFDPENLENSTKQIEDMMEKSASAIGRTMEESASAIERSARSVSNSMNSLESLFDDVYDDDDE